MPPLPEGPDDRRAGLPVFEQNQRRDAGNAVAGRQLGRVVNVELADGKPPVFFGRDLRDRRAEPQAVTAPRGPEVHKNGHGGRKDLLLKIFLRAISE